MSDTFNELVNQALNEFTGGELISGDARSSKYSQQELLSLLSELENEDTQLAEDESTCAIESDDNEADKNIASDVIKNEKLNLACKKWHRDKELKKIQINRMAFDQNLLPMSRIIPIEHKRLVIELLTRPLRNLILKYENYVNHRIDLLLSPAIPAAIKLAYLKWPWVFQQNPGFLYKTHEKCGEIKTFWVTPSVPYFFKQGTEQEILEERDASLSFYFLEKIDRTILRWYKTKDILADREVMYASKLAYIRGNTYYHLLLLNPFWFEKLYNELSKNENRT